MQNSLFLCYIVLIYIKKYDLDAYEGLPPQRKNLRPYKIHVLASSDAGTIWGTTEDVMANCILKSSLLSFKMFRSGYK